MHLYTFEHDGNLRLGLATLQGDGLIDLSAVDPSIPDTMLALIQAGPDAWAKVRQIGAERGSAAAEFAFQQVKIRTPIRRPGKILCSGINYSSHKEENPAATFPREPFIFAKLSSAVIGPDDLILLPKGSEQVDYEVELAVVIGRGMQDVPEAAVPQYVFGYTILHDVSARDVQFRDQQITLGKNFDSFCPIGPCIVTTDQIRDPGKIGLRSYVNGELRQNGSTAEWIFSLNQLLSFLSGIMTLEPGDIISTGTPAGVGLFRNPPAFLKPGDVVRLEAEGIGHLENVVSKR
jgi:2,4-didehydro-3-deoxy-L-rhamnonate hydrolase